MAVSWWAAALALGMTGFQAGEGPPVAEAVNLRGGAVLLGQVDGVDRRGDLNVIARRAWVGEAFPERVAGWERLEADAARLVRVERGDRLVSWREARAGSAPAGDPVLPWITQELGRLADPRPPRTVLMRVVLPRGEVVSVARRDGTSTRLLRLGWRVGLPDVETMTAAAARDALAVRVKLRADDPVAVDDLLPPGPEADATWLKRRAVTEAYAEPGLRFVRFREFILPESDGVADARQPDTTNQVLDSTAALEAFRSIQRVTPGDPVRVRLAAAARRGRVGAIVSRVELSADSDVTTAESALWVRQEGGNWSAVATRSAAVRVDEPFDPLRPGPVAIEFPIRTALSVVELLAAAPASPDDSGSRQAAAAAVQRALGRARALLDAEIAPFALPVAARSRR